MHRSTTLNLLLKACPAALDLYAANTPYDRTVYQSGIAAHAVLQALIDHPDDDVTARAESVVRDLVTNGRTFYGQTEPPMALEPAIEGRDVALSWLARDFDGLGEGWEAEVMLSVDREWQPCDHESAWLHAVVDVVGPCEYADDEFDAAGVLCRDWKGSYATESTDLDALQQKIQACLVAAHNPDVAFIRRQVTSLRKVQTYIDDLWLDEEGQETLAQWRRDIEHLCAQSEAVGDDGRRPARPGPCCGGCPYVLACEDAASVEWAENERDPIVIARAYATTRAIGDELAKTLRAATRHAPIEIDGMRVGYSTRETQTPRDDAVETLARAWFDPADWATWERENGEVLGLLTALRPGTAAVKALGRALFPAKGPGRVDDFRELREAWEAATLATKARDMFGVAKVEVE